jgi:putative oxidoreductase
MRQEGQVQYEHVGAKWARGAPYWQSVLRIVAAFVFMLFGASKLWAFPAPMLPDGETARVLSLAWEAGLLEVFGGGLVLLGLFTRPIAFVLAGEMAVAYFKFHLPKGFWPTVNGGVPAVLFCFIWLFISAAGPGPWSLDALVRLFRRRR